MRYQNIRVIAKNKIGNVLTVWVVKMQLGRVKKRKLKDLTQTINTKISVEVVIS